MQPWSEEFIPTHFSAPSSSYMYSSNFRLYRLFAYESLIKTGSMAPSQIVPPWLRNRAQSQKDPQQLEGSTTTPRLRRSLSFASTSTTPSSSPTSPTDHARRLPVRLSSLIRRQHAKEKTNQDSKASQPQYAAYSPNPEPAAPRSAPSIITSFPDEQVQVSTSNPQALYLQHMTASPSIYGISHSNPVSAITLSADISNDPLETDGSSQTEASNTLSSTSYTSRTTSQPSSTIAESLRKSTSSSDPHQLQRTSSETTISDNQENEATDAFSSPSEYALFVAATSSLSFDDATTAPIGLSSMSDDQITPARLAAPLPPVPQADSVQPLLSQASMTLAQPRSQSYPPQRVPIQTFAGRQNRSQIVAEALLGLEHDTDEQNSDDELPDYATSQMEANARQRWEATQRARELDEAWRRRRIRE